MAPLYALWAVPRSASTAFERMIVERGDLMVVNEPFSVSYYDGPQARSDRFGCTDPTATFARVRADLLETAADRPTFLKDMAYHVASDVDQDLLVSCRHSFLVRHPAWSIPSLARRWPDFTPEETGFDAVARLVGLVEAAGQEVVLIDSDDLRRDPEATARAWCRAVGLAFEPAALQWEPGMEQGWERWKDWHTSTASSAGFVPPDPVPPQVDDPRVREAIDAARPVYESLRSRRLIVAEAS